MPLTSIADVQHDEGLTASGFLPHHGSQIVEVRTFMKKDKSDDDVVEVAASTGEGEASGSGQTTNQVEVSGAECVLRGDRFAAEVVTPAGVRVPLFGYQTGELTLECSKDGFESGIAVVKIYNKTFAERNANAASGGLIGVLVIGLFNAVSDQSNDEFEYLDTPVVLEKIGEQDS